MHWCIINIQHDDGAGQERTRETALRGRTKYRDRARTPQGRAQRIRDRQRHTYTGHSHREHTMKKGHCTGHKRERSGKGNNWWYASPEAEEIMRKIEAEWA